uniref:Secreted protein n=1 Tax=Steinernema glaseri TaxID=37863 RepID=A0A1I8A0T5_9BILA
MVELVLRHFIVPVALFIPAGSADPHPPNALSVFAKTSHHSPPLSRSPSLLPYPHVLVSLVALWGCPKIADVESESGVEVRGSPRISSGEDERDLIAGTGMNAKRYALSDLRVS